MVIENGCHQILRWGYLELASHLNNKPSSQLWIWYELYFRNQVLGHICVFRLSFCSERAGLTVGLCPLWTAQSLWQLVTLIVRLSGHFALSSHALAWSDLIGFGGGTTMPTGWHTGIEAKGNCYCSASQWQQLLRSQPRIIRVRTFLPSHLIKASTPHATTEKGPKWQSTRETAQSL